jgi:hypothetical protein
VPASAQGVCAAHRKESAMKTVLKPVLRRLYHGSRSFFFYPRAVKIARDYATHYRNAQQFFVARGNSAKPLVESVTDVRLRVNVPGAKENFIELPDTYPALVERVHRDVEARFKHTSNCLFFPKLKLASMPEKTEELASLKDGEVLAIQLKDYLDIDALQDLSSLILSELEHKVYRSHIIVDKVYIYRSLVSHHQEQVSWMWHYDNHPNGILKVMIYLTDVAEWNGPFEYLRSTGSLQALRIAPKPLLGYTRISAQTLQQYLSNGYERYKVTGPSGTMFLFDENIIHKANIPERGHRDVIVLQMRPSTFHPERYIDNRWTGSFQHIDFNPDPYDYKPREKSRMHSG